MEETLRRMREKRANGDSGFTLIELLVVVVIIGILVAIAIPLYMNYRKGAANKTAEADVRGAIAVAEQYYTENANAYPATQVGTLSNALSWSAGAYKAVVSTGNTLSYENNTTSYIICGLNADGGTVYIYNSALGGSVKASTQATLALCISTDS